MPASRLLSSWLQGSITRLLHHSESPQNQTASEIADDSASTGKLVGIKYSNYRHVCTTTRLQSRAILSTIYSNCWNLYYQSTTKEIDGPKTSFEWPWRVKHLAPWVSVFRSCWCKSEGVWPMRRRTPEKPHSYFNACPSPSNDSMRPAWQTRSQFPSLHRDHSRHDFSLFSIMALGN